MSKGRILRGIYSNLPRWAPYNCKGLHRGRRLKERDGMMKVVRRDALITARGPWAKCSAQHLEAGRGKESISPVGPPQGTQFCWQFTFNWARPVLDFWPPKHRVINLSCFKSLNLWLFVAAAKEVNTVFLIKPCFSFSEWLNCVFPWGQHSYCCGKSYRFLISRIFEL